MLGNVSTNKNVTDKRGIIVQFTNLLMSGLIEDSWNLITAFAFCWL